eukprot:9142997-Pyramimonas_sp.AAC.1
MVSGAFVGRPEAVVEPFGESLGVPEVDLGGSFSCTAVLQSSDIFILLHSCALELRHLYFCRGS